MLSQRPPTHPTPPPPPKKWKKKSTAPSTRDGNEVLQIKLWKVLIARAYRVALILIKAIIVSLFWGGLLFFSPLIYCHKTGRSDTGVSTGMKFFREKHNFVIAVLLLALNSLLLSLFLSLPPSPESVNR